MIKLKSLLSENVQLATRLYKDKLEAADIEWLDRVTDGVKDHTYKTLVELLLEEKSGFRRWNMNEWKEAYNQLLNYNSNVFPIQGFSFDSKTPTVTKIILTRRANILRHISSWPKNSLRNLRDEVRLPRRNFEPIENTISYINHFLHLLDNKTEEQKQVILKKIFSSNHTTFDDVRDFLEDKENLIAGNYTLSKEDLYKMIEKHDYDLKIVYDKGDIVIVDVTGQDGMTKLGCNSLWCFSYGTEYNQGGENFYNYSHNGHVYTIIDFSNSPNDKSFMHVVIKPFEQGTEDDPGIYDMTNQEEYGDPKSIVQHLTGDPAALSVFKWEDI